jgi:thioredoxin 1
MRNVLYSFLVIGLLFSCGPKEGQQDLSASEFQKAMSAESDAQILDVRTIDEFQNGHIEGAINADVNSAAFQQIASDLNKDKTVFVYCLSGARSASAAGMLKEMGFKSIVNLTGGMLSWRSANLPVATGEAKPALSAGLTEATFAEKIKGKPMVIIDYNATWCGPCKKLSPILKEWVKAQNGKVELIEIDVDENQELAKAKNIESIPYLEMYKNGIKTWTSLGLIGKEELDKSVGSGQ